MFEVLWTVAYKNGCGEVATPADIADGCGLSRTTVWRELKKLMNAGVVCRVAHGEYVIRMDSAFLSDMRDAVLMIDTGKVK